MATKAEKSWMDKVAQLSCAICNDIPVEVHHIREGQGAAQRAGNFLTVPLCPSCHRGPLGVHGTKSMLRLTKKTELDLLNETIQQVLEGM